MIAAAGARDKTVNVISLALFGHSSEYWRCLPAALLARRELHRGFSIRLHTSRDVRAHAAFPLIENYRGMDQCVKCLTGMPAGPWGCDQDLLCLCDDVTAASWSDGNAGRPQGDLRPPLAERLELGCPTAVVLDAIFQEPPAVAEFHRPR
jgi:hypothetical protein